MNFILRKDLVPMVWISLFCRRCHVSSAKFGEHQTEYRTLGTRNYAVDIFSISTDKSQSKVRRTDGGKTAANNTEVRGEWRRRSQPNAFNVWPRSAQNTVVSGCTWGHVVFFLVSINNSAVVPSEYRQFLKENVILQAFNTLFQRSIPEACSNACTWATI